MLTGHGIKDDDVKERPLSASPKPSDANIHPDTVGHVCSAFGELFALQREKRGRYSHVGTTFLNIWVILSLNSSWFMQAKPFHVMS